MPPAALQGNHLAPPPPLRARPARSYERVEGWGMAVGGDSTVLRPTSVDEVRACFDLARRERASLGLRGTGCSYGDASCNERGHVLDLTRMNRLIAFDAATGVAEVEGGFTIEQLWKHALPLGYWPKVVSGTMFPTLAGAAAMNIHGKNNYAVGTIGDAIREFDLVAPGGELFTCSRTQNADLFHAAIGGFGMLGVITRVVIGTKRVHSGDLEVRAFANRNLREMMQYFEAHKATSDYLVGWIDCFGGGEELGRGLVHDARYLDEGEDDHPERTLALAHQQLPASILGFPKSEVWKILRYFSNDVGIRAINTAKYWSGRLESMGEPHRQSHAAFAFLLDYVPGWKLAYGPGGLIQYQSFLPNATAHDAYVELMRWNQRRGFVPYLGVFKRHRPDPFWLTHAVDGWSFAMDFKVVPARRAELWKHCAELTEIVLGAGGKFYFAKDLVIAPRDVQRMFPAERLDAFVALKRRLDPDGLLQTDLWRRVFQPWC
ncbi:MAG: FAD-binding oxidoreductase [Planctomycetota bacterium]|nr:MAG: FAD-binding oxidoreductase [Planctomycetota bacterium]